jgi:hypothetical protein
MESDDDITRERVINVYMQIFILKLAFKNHFKLLKNLLNIKKK